LKSHGFIHENGAIAFRSMLAAKWNTADTNYVFQRATPTKTDTHQQRVFYASQKLLPQSRARHKFDTRRQSPPSQVHAGTPFVTKPSSPWTSGVQRLRHAGSKTSLSHFFS